MLNERIIYLTTIFGTGTTNRTVTLNEDDASTLETIYRDVLNSYSSYYDRQKYFMSKYKYISLFITSDVPTLCSITCVSDRANDITCIATGWYFNPAHSITIGFVRNSATNWVAIIRSNT